MNEEVMFSAMGMSVMERGNGERGREGRRSIDIAVKRLYALLQVDWIWRIKTMMTEWG